MKYLPPIDGCKGYAKVSLEKGQGETDMSTLVPNSYIDVVDIDALILIYIFFGVNIY